MIWNYYYVNGQKRYLISNSLRWIVILMMITFLYGKPCKKDDSFKAKYCRFVYWFLAVFITFGLMSALILCFFNTSLLPATILLCLVVPFFVRFVYSANLKIQGLSREK